MAKAYTVQARSVAKIVNFASRYGVKADALYDSIKLDPAVLVDPDRRIPFAQLVALYENAAGLSGDPCFGLHLGESIDLTAFDLLGYVVLNSQTVGEALKRAERYHSIWTDGSRLALEINGATARLTYAYADPLIAERRQDAEVTFALITSFRGLAADAD